MMRARTWEMNERARQARTCEQLGKYLQNSGHPEVLRGISGCDGACSLRDPSEYLRMTNGQLGQHGLHDFAVHVGQAEPAALELVGQTFVVDAEDAQDRRLEVVHVDAVGRDVVAELVGFAI